MPEVLEPVSLMFARRNVLYMFLAEASYVAGAIDMHVWACSGNSIKENWWKGTRLGGLGGRRMCK